MNVSGPSGLHLGMMVPRIPFSADELFALSEIELREVRGAFFTELDHQGLPPEVHDAILAFFMRMTMLQDMRSWGALAEPGLAGKLMELGPEWEVEIDPAREVDRHSIQMHAEVTEEFEAAGGKEGFAKALADLNAFATAQ